MAKVKRKKRGAHGSLPKIDVGGAEKKLRQAKFFLHHLLQASQTMVRHVSQPGSVNPELLEYYFSACLSAAQSVYYILEKTGGLDFKKLQATWRAGIPEKAEFGNMIGLRGNDVHFGETGAEQLPKLVKAEPSEFNSYYNTYNAALFGPETLPEHENPDGSKVTGHILRGSLGLYLDWEGKRIAAETLCDRFIRLLQSLLEKTKAAVGEDT